MELKLPAPSRKYDRTDDPTDATTDQPTKQKKEFLHSQKCINVFPHNSAMFYAEYGIYALENFDAWWRNVVFIVRYFVGPYSPCHSRARTLTKTAASNI